MNRRLIESLGMSDIVHEINSAFTALSYFDNAEKLALFRPSHIILDLNMPGLSGWDFLKKFAELDPDKTDGIEITILTHSENPKDAERAMQFPSVRDFIVKPLTREHLLALKAAV